jgi:opacity protein-like surface antigen
MKKTLILVFAVCLTAGTVNAQKYYARLGVGVGLGLTYYGESIDRNISGSTSDVSEIKSGSLGTGLNVNLGLGYMFSKYIGAELGFNEFIGFGVKTKYDQTQGAYSQQFDDKYSCKMFQIIPALVITPGFDKINPYGRFGLIIGIGHTNYSYTNTRTDIPELKAANTTVENYKDKDSGGIALGFSTAVGVDYKLNEKFSLYAEINMNGVNYSPKKGKVVEWTKDGVDQIPLLTTKDLEWEYVKTLDNMANIPDNSPDQFLKESAVLTNVGISIGLKFNFGGAN